MIKLLLQYWSPCMNQKGTLDLLVYLSLQAPTSYIFHIDFLYRSNSLQDLTLVLEFVFHHLLHYSLSLL